MWCKAHIQHYSIWPAITMHDMYTRAQSSISVVLRQAACACLQGMRQDLVVQRIGDALAVRIYEAAARAALEHGDLPEYNQCQARLLHLYRAGAPGCHEEFLAYRILYQLAHMQGGGNAALVSTLHQVSGQVRADVFMIIILIRHWRPQLLLACMQTLLLACEESVCLCCTELSNVLSNEHSCRGTS